MPPNLGPSNPTLTPAEAENRLLRRQLQIRDARIAALEDQLQRLQDDILQLQAQVQAQVQAAVAAALATAQPPQVFVFFSDSYWGRFFKQKSSGIENTGH